MGLPRRPGVMTQTVSEIYLHAGAAGAPPELWAKIEFQPWFSALGQLPDQDGDGFPEVYARAKSVRLTPEARALVVDDYAGKTLDKAQITAWANRLASYWYPSFNTDLVPAGEVWPEAGVEPEIQRELGGKVYAAPTIVMRGKPQGVPTYDVFVVRGECAGCAAVAHHRRRRRSVGVAENQAEPQHRRSSSAR